MRHVTFITLIDLPSLPELEGPSLSVPATPPAACCC